MFFFNCSEVQKKETPIQPNILFIAVDNLRPELSSYENKIVKRPNFYKLGS